MHGCLDVGSIKKSTTSQGLPVTGDAVAGFGKCMFHHRIPGLTVVADDYGDINTRIALGSIVMEAGVVPSSSPSA